MIVAATAFTTNLPRIVSLFKKPCAVMGRAAFVPEKSTGSPVFRKLPNKARVWRVRPRLYNPCCAADRRTICNATAAH